MASEKERKRDREKEVFVKQINYGRIKSSSHTHKGITYRDSHKSQNRMDSSETMKNTQTHTHTHRIQEKMKNQMGPNRLSRA